MIRTFFIAFAALSLASCGVASTGVLPTPVEYANRTAADEQVRLAVENGYKAFRMALELGVDTGVIKGDHAVRAAKADQTAYTALLVFRQAYKTANSDDLLAAGRSANIAIAQAIAAVKGN